MSLLRLVTAILLVLPAMAQKPTADRRNVDAADYGDIFELPQTWLFAPDDKPAYASPTFDDSCWKIFTNEKDTWEQGYRHLTYFWYRMHLHLRPGVRDVMLNFQNTNGGYQAFVNGVLIGGNGRITTHNIEEEWTPSSYRIPDGLLAKSRGDLVVALRCSTVIWRGETVSPLFGGTTVYLAGQEVSSVFADYDEAYFTTIRSFLTALSLLTGLISLVLYLALRRQQEYLAVAVCLLAACASSIVQSWSELHTLEFSTYFLFDAMNGFKTVALIEFVRLVLRLPRTRQLAVLAAAAFFFQFAFTLFKSGYLPLSVPIYYVWIINYPALLLVDGTLLTQLIGGWRRGNSEAPALLPSILIISVTDVVQMLNFVAYNLHLVTSQGAFSTVSAGVYRIQLASLESVAFYVTILLFIVLRTIRITRDRAKVAGEIEAAQTVQQLLLARNSEPTPGFEVQTVYHPASEVGGDFFLVSPSPDGSVVGIVGDVSGKGLTASMRVSMIIGVLRRETSREPALILRSLNEALHAQSELGFTTACCVRLELNGYYTVANAGHIPPYVEGGEISTPAELPLGLSSEQTYTEVSGNLPAGQKLVLLSDGVIEATSANGELCGFERTAKLSLMPAQQIADEARSFGQVDDITVLSIACYA